jgi:hypothetical protein
MLTWQSRTVIGGPGCAYRGPVFPRGGPVQLIHPGIQGLEPSTWWGRVLFSVRLEIDVRAPCLHTVVKGTPDSGHRQLLLHS